MKVSVNALRLLNNLYHSAGDPAPNGIDELVQKIGSQLGAVEEIIPFGERFEGVVIIRIMSCVDHQNSDHLHVCMIDDGGVVNDVERDEHGYVKVVTGAPNVRTGFVAAWLPPGTTVPDSVGKEPFILEARALRGEMSNGMLASARELTLGDDHTGILELDNDIAPGTSFTNAFNLRDDVIIDMENKMFTHRPDCFGWLGIAREIAGIYRSPYKSPDWYTLSPTIPRIEGQELKLEVRNEIPDLVPRFVAMTMSNVNIGPSPLWVRIDLARAGMKSINNVVDCTNIYMLKTGQPIHAYDYDKVKALCDSENAVLTIRHPKPGESITLLNGKTITPRPESMMVATDKKLICLGGAMGGKETEVDQNTRNIILEAANWDMYEMRRTSMAHGIFTDAVTRFTKGQSPLQNPSVIVKIADEIHKFADGSIAGPLIDDNHLSDDVMSRGNLHPSVTLSRQFVETRLGISISAEDMAELLQNVEISVVLNGDNMTVSAPFWRTDIAIREDVVEEIGRLYGYDLLPLYLPKRDISPAVRNPSLDMKSDIREYLSGAGATELLTYSFVHGNLLSKVGQDSSLAFQISNALSPDLQYYRISLLPSLLDKVHSNIKTGYNEFALFEMNLVHITSEIDSDGLPSEDMRLALVYAAESKAADKVHSGGAYYQARLYVGNVLEERGISNGISYRPMLDSPNQAKSLLNQMFSPFEPKRSALIYVDNRIVGIVGEFKRSVQKSLKLPEFCSGFELILTNLDSVKTTNYQQLPRFPKVEQDICLKVSSDISYQSLFDVIKKQLDILNPSDKAYFNLLPLDIFQRDEDKDHRQITFRLSIASFERTLTDVEVNSMLSEVASVASTELKAERI